MRYNYIASQAELATLYLYIGTITRHVTSVISPPLGIPSFPQNRFASKPGPRLRAQGKAQSHPLQAQPPFAQLLHSRIRSHPNLTKIPSPDLSESETTDLHSVLSRSERRNPHSLVSKSEMRNLHSLLPVPNSQESRGSTPARLLCSV